MPPRLESALLDLGQRVECQGKDLLDRSTKIATIATIATTVTTVNLMMFRVERQGKDLMDRQKDIGKDSSKLGKDEVIVRKVMECVINDYMVRHRSWASSRQLLGSLVRGWTAREGSPTPWSLSAAERLLLYL